MVKHTLLHTPSAFNSQSTRIVVLLKKDHQKLWDITKEIFKGRLRADQFETTSKKLDGFRGAYGSVREVSLKTQNVKLMLLLRFYSTRIQCP